MLNKVKYLLLVIGLLFLIPACAPEPTQQEVVAQQLAARVKAAAQATAYQAKEAEKIALAEKAATPTQKTSKAVTTEPSTFKMKEYSGCSGLQDLIPELAIAGTDQLQLWSIAQMGRDDSCNTVIEQLNTPKNLKSYYTDEAVAKREATKAVEDKAAAETKAVEDKAALVEAQRLERELGFSWISGGPTDDGYIHIQEGESQELTIVKVHGSISVADSLIIDWGDGNTDSVKLQPGSREFTLPNHIYVRSGEFEAYIQGTDTDGNDKALNFKALVGNAPPTIENVTTPLISLDIEAEFEMQLGNTYQDSHFVIMSWGDGSPISTYSLGPGENTLSFNHTYTVGNEGKPYYLGVELHDEHGSKVSTQETLWFAESFRKLDSGAPPVMYKKTSLSLHIPTVGYFFISSNESSYYRYNGGNRWSLRSPLDGNKISISSDNDEGASIIALNDSQIFILGPDASNSYSRVGIYDIPSDTWSYPLFDAIIPYKLFGPALYVLDSGEVLITGGVKITKIAAEYNELSFIYNPTSQTISSIENNPIAGKLQGIPKLVNVDAIHFVGRYGVNSDLIRTAAGEIVLFQSSSRSPDVILATAFDPKSKSYKPIRGDTKVHSFNIKSCGVYDKPILLNDGRIFWQTAIISSDLSNVIQIDPSNLDWEKCLSPTFYHFRGYGSILLPDSNVLFVGQTGSFIFDGNKYRDTKYQNGEYLGQNIDTIGYNPTITYDHEERIVIFGGSDGYGKSVASMIEYIK